MGIESLASRVLAERKLYDRSELVQAYRASALNQITWGIVKNQHWALPRDLALDLIRATKVHEIPYDPRKRNCDEFAELLRYRVWRMFGWRGVGFICDYEG